MPSLTRPVSRSRRLRGSVTLLLAGVCLATAASAQSTRSPDIHALRIHFLNQGVPQALGFFARGEALPAIEAQLRYSGSGFLQARWEVIQPGDPEPTELDLRPEAGLALEERVRQHRYTVLERVHIHLPPSGQARIAGPDPRRVPAQMSGIYTALLRIEPPTWATQVTAVEPTTLRLPVMRYVVGATRAQPRRLPNAPVEPLRPFAPQGLVSSDRALSFSWRGDPDATMYRIEVRRADGGLYSARVRPDVTGSSQLVRFTPPAFVQSGWAPQPLDWRVMALDGFGQARAHSRWIPLQWAALK